MSMDQLRTVRSFRSAFARRQAAEVVEVPGGFAVLDEEFRQSHEHNQLIVDGDADPGELLGLAERTLGRLRHRRIAVADERVAEAAAPGLLAAGYVREFEVVMVHAGPLPAEGEAEAVGIADLRPAEEAQWREWLPKADAAVIRQLTGRRAARLRGADEVRFLAVRDGDGEIGAWTDLYVDRASGTAQIEDLVTAADRRCRGLGDAVLAGALRRAADCDLRFLIADAEDWPQHWYARRGFTPIGRSFAFTRIPTAG